MASNITIPTLSACKSDPIRIYLTAKLWLSTVVCFCMHPSWKLPVNARDVIESAGYKTQFHSKGAAKTGVRSDLSVLFVGQSQLVLGRSPKIANHDS